MGDRALRKAQLKEFLLDHLVPRLEDQDWLLLNDDGLAKVRDEMLLGLHCDRSSSSAQFVIQVYIRPLYWPADPVAYGLTEKIGRWGSKEGQLGDGWFYLDGPELAAEVAARLAPVINRGVIPFFAHLPDAKAVLGYGSLHPLDPLLGCVRSGNSCGHDLIAYMWAWSGDRRKARGRLKAAMGDLRRHIDRIQHERTNQPGYRPPPREVAADREWLEGMEKRMAHLQQTRDLLDRPEELRDFLQAMANHNRVALKVDRARPVLEMLANSNREPDAARP